MKRAEAARQSAFAVFGACLGSGCVQLAPGIAPDDELAASVAALGLPGDGAVIVGAGDIARCDAPDGAAATARLVAAVIEAAPGAAVFTTGDHAYEEGTAAEFRECYGPLWGRFNPRTYPTPGNHDYETGDAAAYYDYFDLFDERPGVRPTGYYSYELGEWQIVVLNSMLAVEPGAVQVEWLERTLAGSDRECVLAYWHHPLFSSGYHGAVPWDAGRDTRVFWEILGAHGADVVVNGHDHLYERFEPQDADGRAVPDGIRQFTVGTGGGGLHPVVRRRPNSTSLTNQTYGVLVVLLGADGYEWAFIGTDGIVHDRSDAAVACRGG